MNEQKLKLIKTYFIIILAIIIVIVLFISSANSATAAYAKYIPAPRYGEILCKKDGFECLKVGEKIIEIKAIKKGKKIIVRKATADTWESLFPDEKIRTLIMKLNRLNIVLKKGIMLAAPKNRNKTLADFSPFPKWIKAPEEKLIIFDPALLAFAAYKPNGELAKWGPAIGGMDRCLDTWRRCRTIVGTWKIELIGDEKSRSHIYPIGCGSKKRPCALMAWFIGFYKCLFSKCLYGFHASEKMEGRHASHGCIRLFLDDAKWLNQNFVEIGTKVITRPYPNKPQN